MLWVVRGTDRHTNEDISIVLEADSAAQAEYMGERRGIPVVVVSQATPEDIRIARAEGRCFQFTPEPREYRCLGRPVRRFEMACLMICGLMTAVLVFGVL
jgi:hypothetical protein